MLAMEDNDDACCLNTGVVRTFIASKLAPTEGRTSQPFTKPSSNSLPSDMCES
ncbi:hypothetical protein PS918_04823 [Pseudomonas fluorescens]|uniref:Uncharacterized protein n=1 Tax=Pseudomonas fluorescens TaxID=294 RepID=A0A5E7UAU5_PSEFL|nr:hypothetical protein PS918_04823 [Pseudomonas fluorescens]